MLAVKRHRRLAQMYNDQLIVLLDARPEFSTRIVPDIAKDHVGRILRSMLMGDMFLISSAIPENPPQCLNCPHANHVEARSPRHTRPFTPKFTKPFSSWPKTGRPPGYYNLPLPDEAVAFYRENGFLVVENCISPEEIAELRDETTQVCRGNRGAYGGIAETKPEETDDEILRRYLCIHFPHKISETMKRYVAHTSYVDILTRIIGPNVKCMQSMLFIKASGKPGQAWHQDEFYIPTRDCSLTGGWLAMDDATVENGCLWVLPGSHRRRDHLPARSNDTKRTAASIVPESPISFPTATTTPFPSKSKLAASSSSTAISCTAPCPTTPSPVTGACS